MEIQTISESCQKILCNSKLYKDIPYADRIDSYLKDLICYSVIIKENPSNEISYSKEFEIVCDTIDFFIDLGKKNEQNNYSENFLNTETSVKSTSTKSKKDYSLGKNTHVRDHYKQNLNHYV